MRTSVAARRVRNLAAILSFPVLWTCSDISGPGPDRTGPELSFTSPRAEGVVPSDTLAVEGVARDDRRVAQVVYRLNSEEPQSLALEPAKEVPLRFVLRGLRLGANTLEVSVTDEAQQTTTQKIGFAVTDTTAPALALESPVETSAVDADTVVVQGVVTDMRGVARLRYSVNGGAEQTVVVDSGAVRAGFRFVARGLRLGANEVELRASDGSGNTATMKRTLNARDVRAPEVRVEAPAEAGTVDGDTAVVRAVIVDDRAVAAVSYRLNGGAEQVIAVDSARRAEVRFVVRGLELGRNQVEIRTRDVAQNAASLTRTFTVVDATPPAVTIDTLLAEDVLTDPVRMRVRGRVTDLRGVTRVAYVVDGGAEITVEVAPTQAVSYGFTLEGLSRGMHRLQVLAWDESGNRAELARSFSAPGLKMQITSPRPDTTLHRLAAYIEGTIEQSIPLWKLTMSVNGGPEELACTTQWVVPCTIEAAGKHDFTVLADSLPAGPVEVVLYAYDQQGNRAGQTSVRFRTDVPVKRYAPTYLGGLGGGDSRGWELNEKNEVVGWAQTPQGSHRGFVWDGTRLVDLGVDFEGDVYWERLAINDSSRVVGAYRTGCSGVSARSFTWSLKEGGSPIPIGDGCGYVVGDINDAGKVAVSIRWPNTGYGSYILDRGKWVALVRDDSYEPQVRWMNDRDEVLAFTGGTQSKYAWLYTDRPPTYFGRFDTTRDLNDLGDYLTQDDYYNARDGAIVTAGGTGTEVVTPGLAGLGEVSALNNQRHIAGTFVWVRRVVDNAFVDVRRPYLWADGRPYTLELTDAAWQVDSVQDINDRGVILAHAVNRVTGQKGAVLLTPVP